PPSTISNTARVTSATPDPNLSNNRDNVTTDVISEPDVTVTKTDSPDPVVAGQEITYTIIVTNLGPSTARMVSLAAPIPAGPTFVSATQTAGPMFTLTPPTVGDNVFTATRATLAPGASARFELVVRVSDSALAGTIISNTALVSADNEPEENLGNN